MSLGLLLFFQGHVPHVSAAGDKLQQKKGTIILMRHKNRSIQCLEPPEILRSASLSVVSITLCATIKAVRYVIQPPFALIQV